MTDQIWKNLSNSKSYFVKSLKDAEKYAEHYGRGIGHYFKSNEATAPLILFRDNEKPYVINGETRLRIARALNIYPSIFSVYLKDDEVNNV